MRTLGWVVVVASCLGCAKRAPAPVVPNAKPTAAAPSVPAPPPVPQPEYTLSEIYGAEVSVYGPVETPNGTVVGYTFDAAESLIGEMTADGHDVQAEIDAAEAECEAEVSAMTREERWSFEVDDRTCEEGAVGDVLGDDALIHGCGQAGIAYFGIEGKLVSDESFGTECTDAFQVFEVRELGPKADRTLWMTVTSHSDLGDFDRGGWGFRTSSDVLYVLPLGGGADDAELGSMAEFGLGDYREGGQLRRRKPRRRKHRRRFCRPRPLLAGLQRV